MTWSWPWGWPAGSGSAGSGGWRCSREGARLQDADQPVRLRDGVLEDEPDQLVTRLRQVGGELGLFDLQGCVERECGVHARGRLTGLLPTAQGLDDGRG